MREIEHLKNITSQRARKFKKVQAKKLVKSNKLKIFFREIAFLAVLNFFPSSKIDFWPFLKLQKMEFGQKKIPEIDLFDFTNFLAWTFLTVRLHIFFQPKY